MALSSCGEDPAGPPPALDGPTLVYRVLEGEVPDAAQIMTDRLQDMGVPHFSLVPIGDGRVELRLPQLPLEKQDELQRVLGLPGVVQFRVTAEESVERKEGAKREESGELYREPAGYRWLPEASGQREYLIEFPEENLADRIRTHPDETAEERAAILVMQNDLAELIEREVFDSWQIELAEVRHDPQRGPVVWFEFREDQREPFADFTERYVGRLLAIVVDDYVLSAPRIAAPLPGAGLIEGPPFTQSAAEDLAIAMRSRPLHVELEEVRQPVR